LSPLVFRTLGNRYNAPDRLRAPPDRLRAPPHCPRVHRPFKDPRNLIITRPTTATERTNPGKNPGGSTANSVPQVAEASELPTHPAPRLSSDTATLGDPSLLGMDSFLQRWKSLQQTVDAALESHLQRLGSDCPARLKQSIAYSLLSPGKRLRPVLCILACEAVGGRSDQSLASAVALEMIHSYSLIHDDLPAMDDDDLRRGRPTCHKQFDEATAILAGDALQPLAFQAILSGNLTPAAAAESCLELAKAAGAEGMVGGQMDDLLAEQRDTLQMPLVEQKHWLDAIHRRKTGALLQASVVLGAIAGQATPAQRAALGRYGQAIGIAFQIGDDLLDVVSTPENTGKATGKDSTRGKLTFPAVYGIELSREKACGWVQEAIASIQPLGASAAPLQWLAKYILERSN
jgi:geranylgeranyl diphosphate synthase, type II